MIVAFFLTDLNSFKLDGWGRVVRKDSATGNWELETPTPESADVAAKTFDEVGAPPLGTLDPGSTPRV